MKHALSLLAGAGLGAGVMYMLDPDRGRRRRALTRDKAVRRAHDVRDAASVIARDMANRARGLASGDLSILVGGRRALKNPLRGSWSPAARALMTATGFCLFGYGLTQRAPTACVLGTAGLALMAEGISNAGIDDIGRVCQESAHTTIAVTNRIARHMGLGHDGVSRR